ncbi:MAG: hypothetical protein ABJM06_07440 [Gilvibacter sp.]
MIHRQGFIVQRILPIVLALLLLSPVWVSLAHEAGEHQHPVCDDITTHLHEQAIDCDLCDYNLVSFDVITHHEFAPTLKFVGQTQIFGYAQSIEPITFELKKGRAPPTV